MKVIVLRTLSNKILESKYVIVFDCVFKLYSIELIHCVSVKLTNIGYKHILIRFIVCVLNSFSFCANFLFALKRRIVGDIFFNTDCFLLLKYLFYFFLFDLEVFTCVQMIFCLLNTSFSKILFYRNSYFRTDYVSVIKLSLLFVEFVIYRYYFHTV